MIATSSDIDRDSRRPLPEGWRWARLGDVCQIQLGKMLSPASKTGRRSIPYLRNTNVQWDRFDLGDVTEMDFTPVEERKFALRPGDLLVCEGGEPGRAAVWDGAIPRCCYQKALHRLRPLDTGIVPRFVMYRLWIGAIEGEFLGSHAKTTIAHLPAVRLAQLTVGIPAVSQQHRIVAALGEQMAAVEQARAAAEAQLEAARELPATYLRAVFESDEAKAWPKRRLGDILRLRKDVVHPRDNPRGSATFVGLEHIESGTGIRTGSVPVEMSELSGRKPRFRQGDIVYGYLRPYLNKVWLAEFDGLCSVDQYVYSVTTEADAGFLAWFIRSPVYLERAPIDTTPGQLPRIRTEEVAAVEIGFPALAVQKEVSRRIEEILAQLGAVRAPIDFQRRTIDSLPSTLLQRAFSGQL